MSIIETIYKGDLQTESKRLDYSQLIETDAPKDNNGKGDYFSPTDLVVGALASCILTISGITSKSYGFSIDGAKAKTTKIMSSDQPRRIQSISIEIDYSSCTLTDKEKVILRRVPATCPVSLSLHPDIQQNISFIF